MHRQFYSSAEAARALGVSIDTIRRWDRVGKLRVERDDANRRLIPAAEVERLCGARGADRLSARNHLRGIVRSVRVEGLLAQVEIDVTEPTRIVAVITAESARALELEPGDPAAGVVKATSLMVER